LQIQLHICKVKAVLAHLLDLLYFYFNTLALVGAM